jgi:hypothetical protein
MKIERILLAIAFVAMVVGCTTMNPQTQAPEGEWKKSAAWLPLQVVVEKDGKREVVTQRAPLDFNPKTMMFRFHIEDDKAPEAAPVEEKTE